MGSKPKRSCLRMAPNTTLQRHHPLHPISHHHKPYLSLCIVRLRLPPHLVTMPTLTSKDTHARMDRLEQRLRQLWTSNRDVTWEDFDGVLVANLPAKFRMPEIERYMDISCPRIHLRFYRTIMRAHELDEV